MENQTVVIEPKKASSTEKENKLLHAFALMSIEVIAMYDTQRAKKSKEALSTIVEREV